MHFSTGQAYLAIFIMSILGLRERK